MSAHFRRRLYAHLRETANPFLGRVRSSHVNAPNIWRKVIDPVSNSRRLSTPPSPPSLIRKFATSGFLIFGASPSSAVAENCAKCIRPSKTLPSQLIWRRAIHTPNTRPEKAPSEEVSGNSKETDASQSTKEGENFPDTLEGSPKPPSAPSSGRHLMHRLPHMPHLHRPTKEELLAAATGFWSRLKVRFKWFSIRSVRPFNLDEIAAFFSWVFLGHIVWVVAGTTTFFSLLILAINTVFAQGMFDNMDSICYILLMRLQETLAGWVGNYLTKSSGLQVVFESAIVPKWRNGVITFKNVFVSRRPGQGTGYVSKGSSKTAAAAAAAASRGHPNTETLDQTEEDTNYTQFDVSIETVNVTLSFTKWLNGKGPLRDVESFRHEHHPGDFEIDSFKMHDVLVTLYQPDNFRPFSISIFTCDLPQLRKQWLFYDFLSANMMSGSFDNSLFTIHPRQTHGFTGNQLDESSPWEKHSRIRVDGLNIDHLNRGVEGPFSWIREGNVDIVADIMFPAENDESLAKVMTDFYDRLEATVTSNQISGTHTPGANVDSDSVSEADKRFLAMDLRVHLNNVRAAVPIFTRDLSYINNALIRPIVAYINSKRTFIPINCRLVKRVGDFNGSWTIFDSGLMDDLSAAVSSTRRCLLLQTN
ncbi:Mitochondrial distribution and morphology protein 31 [Penicillium chermesinum]|uniref:Mitochondrial distribution and morphology protein 31 n=1 Tax=Penicillium chermesinum TaxID=63820 RepID=A0A9W9NQ94_9EURO|nr:Mitochondrial distribution and morphology protein 31 [Penicillium chermesinum]KAJ5224145.1 Mitochondrial distribution and morphology protein 31 [Penicillium chermesinum]